MSFQNKKKRKKAKMVAESFTLNEDVMVPSCVSLLAAGISELYLRKPRALGRRGTRLLRGMYLEILPWPLEIPVHTACH